MKFAYEMSSSQKMPRRAPEISMLEMSVARSSTSETTIESSAREVQASPGRAANGAAAKPGRKRRQKENEVEPLKDMAKLKGRQRMIAVGAVSGTHNSVPHHRLPSVKLANDRSEFQLEEVVQNLPSLSDIKEEAIQKYKEDIESLDRILDVLGDDASRVSLNALGDFTVWALK